MGTYTTNTESKGIYTLNVNPSKNVYNVIDIQTGVVNPSFQSIRKDEKSGQSLVYSVGEGSGAGSVHAFSFDAVNGKLTPLNSLPANGRGSCSVTASARHAFIANYSSGNINAFSLKTDGSLDKLVQSVQHHGGSINTDRQKGPHAHQVIFDLTGNYLFSNNLGTDLLYAYRYNAVNSEPLVLVDSLMMEQGGGPRHLAVSPDGTTLYVLQELTGTISIVSFKDEQLTSVGSATVITKPGKPGAADIHLSPDGKFLYATNRIDYNDITVFNVKSSYELEFVAQYSTGGDAPRNFMITRDGKYLFAGNQRTHQIVVFKRDKRKGTLTDIGFKIPVPAPVYHLEF
ncbi:MAG: lactonase family protein [Ignavibacteria bacterium]|nr:lactonase family protein [Ignavibacteria bacterium]